MQEIAGKAGKIEGEEASLNTEKQQLGYLVNSVAASLAK
jgi:hypothetical protein